MWKLIIRKNFKKYQEDEELREYMNLKVDIKAQLEIKGPILHMCC
jgi:hypothetical protein